MEIAGMKVRELKQKKMLVIAATREEFNSYLKEVKVKQPSDHYVFVHSIRDLEQVLPNDYKVMRVGTYYNRPDYYELLKYAVLKRFSIL